MPEGARLSPVWKVGLLPVSCQKVVMLSFFTFFFKIGKQCWSAVVSPNWPLAEDLAVCHNWPLVSGNGETLCCAAWMLRVLDVCCDSFVFLLSHRIYCKQIIKTNTFFGSCFVILTHLISESSFVKLTVLNTLFSVNQWFSVPRLWVSRT